MKQAKIFFVAVAVAMVLCGAARAQLPQVFPDVFEQPLKVRLQTSGTLGELRDNHFHAGTDFRTGVEGVPIYAVGDGRVARIKISPFGYGKAIYIEHPNGFTTVYAHIQRFAEPLQAYVKKLQYERRDFSVEAWPGSELPITKGQLIGYVGNTGGSFGPHLHFEVRHTANSNSLNVLGMGLKVADSRSPIVRRLYLVNIPSDSAVEMPSYYQQIVYPEAASVPVLNVSGRVGLGLDAYDFQDAHPTARNGVQQVEVFVDEQKIYSRRLDSTDFAKDRYINAHILYDVYRNGGPRIEKCYIDPSDRLLHYDRPLGDGTITVEPGVEYAVRIELSDAAGNKTRRRFKLRGNSVMSAGAMYSETDRYFRKYTANSATVGRFRVSFPRGTFYRDLWFDSEVRDSLDVRLHRKGTPVHTSFDVEADVRGVDGADKMYITCNGSALTTSLSGGRLTARASSLGDFQVLADTLPPTISNVKIHTAAAPNNNRISAVIRDTGSGLKSYSATIDGQWALLEYDYKTGIVFFDMSDSPAPGPGEHKLRIVAEDRCGNRKEYSKTFKL